MLLACQRSPQLRTLQTEVLACRPDGDTWLVQTEDTVLYAEGGGQPADHGWLGGVPVLDVQKVDGTVLHRTRGPVHVGTVEAKVDWARRFDHMQQHTAQHLITALAEARFGWKTTSFHLFPRSGDTVPDCDIELEAANVTPAQLAQLQDDLDAHVLAAHPVGHEVVAREDLDDAVRSRGVPEGVTEVRLVSIAGVDVNTCGGTHVTSTGQLGQVVLLGTERLSRGLRLRYIAGGRVRDRLLQDHARSKALSQLLSVGPVEHVAAVERLLQRAKQADKAVQQLLREQAASVGAQLAAADGPVVHWHSEQGDMGLLSSVARHAGDGDRVLFLTAGQREGVFLVLGPPEVLNARKAQLLALLEGRGGGKPGRLQGKAARIDRHDEAVALFG